MHARPSPAPPHARRRAPGPPPGALRASRVLFLLAAACGLLHAIPSFYWAAGGRALLETVGAFAVELADAADPGVVLMLVAIGAAKTAGALVPLIDHARPPAHRWVRVLSWIGAGVLLLWGGAGMAGAWIGVLTGAATWERPAVVGHALLWDPLFVLWGALLALALWTSRPPRGTSRARVA